MKEKKVTNCYHCGEDCGKKPIIYDDKPFCCTGCSFVYEILKGSDACEYYDLEKNPGIKIEQREFGDKYAYLDNEEIRDQLLIFSDGGISKVKFFIPSIHCSSCIWLLENLNRLNKEIVQSFVNFVKKEVQITFRDEKISLREVVELLVSINYVPQISFSETDDKPGGTVINKKLYYKLGVAGFCFGNIMLLSFPEYLALTSSIESEFRDTFSWINLALSLPVIFYAGTDYMVSAWKGLRKKIINIDVPIALGIIAIFVRSVYEILSQTGPGYLDSMSGLVFFLLIGKWYQSKTYQALSFERDYKSYFPVAVTMIKDGVESFLPLKKIKTGDRLLIRNQELIPADSILYNGAGNIDYSFVSGESAPVSKKKGDRIFAGGRQMGNAIEVVVEKEIEQSYLTGLWNQDIESSSDETGMKKIINVVSKYFTMIIISIALATGIYWYFDDPAIAIGAFTAVLIVACPCALALSIPFASGSTMRIFGRKGFYLKKSDVIEDLTKIDTIVFDKTGTITQSDRHKVEFIGELNDKEKALINSVVRHSTHPLSVAVYNSLGLNTHYEVNDFMEHPGLGISCKVNENDIRIGSMKYVTGEEQDTGSLSTRVYVSINDKIPGYFQISNEYRPGLNKVISSLQNNYELHLITGDNESEMKNLIRLFRNKENLHFNQSPTDKLHYIEELKNRGKRVLMIGDGLNDAGALKKSDVGITIADDVFHFSPACDAILEAKKFNSLSNLIKFSGMSMNIVKISFVISFLYNFIGISFAVQGLLSPIFAAILMPVSSVTVVAFATFATILMAKQKII